MTETLVIIPARGGSKGIPGKNLRLLNGEPLLVHSIRQALNSTTVTRVVVSTDSEEIADVAQRANAEVIMRPAEISGDTASSELALRHVLDTLHQSERYLPDLVVFLQATSPMRQPTDIDGAVNTLRAAGADSLFSCCKQHGFVWTKKGAITRPLNYKPEERQMRQSLQAETLIENGSIYVFRPSVLETYGSRLGGRIATYEMHPLDSFQVDEPEDLELMASLMLLRPNPTHWNGLDQIRLLVLDFDGVLTDNRVSVSQDGTEEVVCHRGDGWGIARLRDAGLDVMVLSTEQNPVVAARCRKLGIPAVQGCDAKIEALMEIARAKGLTPREIAYVGNDVNDLECLRWVGVPIAVADSEPKVRSCARFVTARAGGAGAVREVADRILQVRKSALPAVRAQSGNI